MPPSDSKTPAVELSDKEIEEWPSDCNVEPVFGREQKQWVCKKPIIHWETRSYSRVPKCFWRGMLDCEQTHDDKRSQRIQSASIELYA